MRVRHNRSARLAVAAVAVAGVVAGSAGAAGAGESAAALRDAVRTAAHASSPAHARGALLVPLPAPSHFAPRVTNPYLPMRPGMRWRYRGFGSEGHERDVVTVLDRTKQIAGVAATVSRDVVRRRGHVIERTFDWFAQDDRGRVWYLGESTKSFEGGGVSTEGSWEAGVDGAHAGIVMFARARVGVRYWQELSRGTAEDQGELIDRATHVGVGSGQYRHVRMTEETSPLEPGVTEFKFYARGVGVVLELDAAPEQGRVVLVDVGKP